MFNAHPMPRIDLLLNKVGGAQFLSTLKLNKGHWYISLRMEDREKTAFPTPQGLFHSTNMPFGLHGVASPFQSLMDKVVQPVSDCALTYIDDTAISSQMWEEHQKHLRQVLKALRSARLTANPENRQLGKRRAMYLGCEIEKRQV